MIGVGVYLFLVLLFIIIRRCLKVGCVVLQWGHKTYLYVIYFIIIINEHTRFSMESYIQSNSIGRLQEVQTKLLTNDNLT